MARLLAVPMLLLSLAALGCANFSDLHRKSEDEVNSLKGETNLIDHGPHSGSFKPKNFHAYNHFGRKGEQMWRNLSDHEKKRYLKKLRKYKLRQRTKGVSSKDASDDVRLQHLGSLRNDGSHDISGKTERNGTAKKANKANDLERRKKYSRFYAKKGTKAVKKQQKKKKHLVKKNQRP